MLIMLLLVLTIITLVTVIEYVLLNKSAGSVEVDTGYVNSSAVQAVYDIESTADASVLLFGDLA